MSIIVNVIICHCYQYIFFIYSVLDVYTVSHPGFLAESSHSNGIQEWTGDSGMHVYDSWTWV